MICIQMPGAAVFFPDSEIIDAKAITSAESPAIAFRSRGTGGLQFIKRYKTDDERDKALQAISASQRPEDEDMTEKLLERIRATEEELERMRQAQKAEKPKKPKKTRQPKKEKRAKEFTPPTTEEIAAYIKEKEIDKKLDVPADVIAESFRGVYEKEEDTGQKDENGFTIYRTVWRKADGSLVENWKSCLQTFKSRQLIWDAKKSTGQPAKKNQFTEFKQNEYSDEELEEFENM